MPKYTIYPFSARSIAGVRIVVRSSLPEPNSLTVSTQAAAAPGTVTAWAVVVGKEEPVIPSLRRCSKVRAAGVLS